MMRIRVLAAVKFIIRWIWGFRIPRIHISRDAYAFLVLTMISIMLDFIVIAIGLYAINVNNHKFCQVITPVIQNQVIKPVNPKKTPALEQQWEWYQRYVSLDHSLGC